MSQATLPNVSLQASDRVQASAEMLERHIRASKLKPGDRYLSAEEAGSLLGQSAMTAQRAMSLLARRDILTRRPRAGTFVGEAATARDPIPCIQFLLPERFMIEDTAQTGYWAQVHGIRSVLPDASVQFNFVPNQDVDYCRQVIKQASMATSLMGVVLMLPSRSMRTYFNESGIPTLVEGGVEADLINFCWLDWDQFQIGRLLATWLLERGHRRLATIMRDVWSIGEQLLHDGIGEALGAWGLGGDALVVRSVPPDAEAIGELTQRLLSSSTDRPTAFICRTTFQADAVSRAVQAMGLGGEVEVVVGGQATSGPVRYTCVKPEIDAVAQGRMVGTMLRDLAAGHPPEPRGRYIDVALCPADHARGS